MFDDLHSEGLSEGLPRGRRRTPEHARPLTDREVPLGSPTTAIAASLHDWLDGDSTESAARRGESSRDVDFWKRLNEALVQRRRLSAPAGFEARIMAALPMHAPVMRSPWWQRELVLTPANAIAAAAALMAIAASATALLLHAP